MERIPVVDYVKLSDSPMFKDHCLGVGQGWQPMLETLADFADMRTQKYDMPPVEVYQIKEKFGTLRFYYGGGDEAFVNYVRFAEELSGRICEECGAEASTRSKQGWYKTLCEEHI